jgi:hypothetical protein
VALSERFVVSSIRHPIGNSRRTSDGVELEESEVVRSMSEAERITLEPGDFVGALGVPGERDLDAFELDDLAAVFEVPGERDRDAFEPGELAAAFEVPGERDRDAFEPGDLAAAFEVPGDGLPRIGAGGSGEELESD